MPRSARSASQSGSGSATTIVIRRTIAVEVMRRASALRMPSQARDSSTTRVRCGRDADDRRTLALTFSDARALRHRRHLEAELVRIEAADADEITAARGRDGRVLAAR